jgi:site-specific recombinase XerC
LALLIYAVLRVQETCGLQLRDLTMGSDTITVAGQAKRVAFRFIQMPNRIARPRQWTGAGEALVGIAVTTKGQTTKVGITQRVAQRTVQQLDRRAVQHLCAETQCERDITHSEHLEDLARRLETVTSHMLRCSLARRMLSHGAQLREVQWVLGHSRLSTTGIYLTPSEEDLRSALGRAGL